jgi:hypothetical protein
VPESGNLGCFDALGKLRGFCWGRGVGAEGVAGEVGVGGGGAFLGVGAAGEQAGEKASEAQGGYFKEVAFGARGGQKGHEQGSRWCMVMHELRQAYRGASGATMTRSGEPDLWWKRRFGG